MNLVKSNKLRCKNIIVEYIYHPKNKKALILLDGLPSLPEQKQLMNNLSSKGFSVFFPRYAGTWESAGKFLESNPSFDIDNFIKKLNTIGIILKYANKENLLIFEDISIIASSFGGAVALSLKKINLINKIVLLSPVFDFKKVIGIKTLKNYLNKIYPGAYRFETKQWTKLLQGKLISCNTKRVKKNHSKYSVLHGINDNQIKSDDMISFFEPLKIKPRIIENTSHLSLSKIDQDIFSVVIDILSR